MENQKSIEIKAAREDAAKRSRNVLAGTSNEILFTMITPSGDFGYDTRAMTFLGAPIDFIYYDGLMNVDNEVTVVLIEVKKDTSGLNKNQRRIKEAIIAGRVRLDVCTMDTKRSKIGTRSYKHGDEKPREILEDMKSSLNEGLLE